MGSVGFGLARPLVGLIATASAALGVGAPPVAAAPDPAPPAAGMPVSAEAAAPPVAAAATSSEAPPGARFVARWETTLRAEGDRPGFREPDAVSLDPLGNVFVADTGNHRVVQFDPSGRRVFEFGGYGWGEGQLSRPTDVCARDGFRLFVVDAGNDRIQMFDIQDASAEGAVLPFSTGSGLAGEELVRPSRMDLDAEGRIYVSDELGHFVWIFKPTGELTARWGGLGDAPTRFRSPAGVAVGAAGRVYVADAGNRRIQVFDSIGNWLAEWRGPENDPLVDPVGIDVGPDGDVWVADAGARRIRRFTPEGFALFAFDRGEGSSEPFRVPCDVEAGSGGRVWVVDRERGVVDGFRILRTDADAGER